VIGAPTAGLVLDVDGVLSPLHGHTAWGDDQVAGDLFGPVDISPSLVRRLEAIADQPHVLAAWLTDWPPRIRARMRGFPGQDWPDIGDAHRHQLPRGPDRGWWKPQALRAWLDDQPSVIRLAWCDDDLAFPRTDTTRDTDLDLIPLLGRDALAGRRLFAPGSTQAELHLPTLAVLLTAPDPSAGLTVAEIDRIEGFLGTSPDNESHSG
jgi:hypothetical protein